LSNKLEVVLYLQNIDFRTLPKRFLDHSVTYKFWPLGSPLTLEDPMESQTYKIGQNTLWLFSQW